MIVKKEMRVNKWLSIPSIPAYVSLYGAGPPGKCLDLGWAFEPTAFVIAAKRPFWDPVTKVAYAPNALHPARMEIVSHRWVVTEAMLGGETALCRYISRGQVPEWQDVCTVC